jgi:hypothetical protein
MVHMVGSCMFMARNCGYGAFFHMVGDMEFRVRNL